MKHMPMAQGAQRRLRGWLVGTGAGAVVTTITFALAALLIAALLSGCGGSSTELPGAGAGPDITPIAPSGWATYANTTFHYTIQYPANWFIADTSPTLEDVEIYNFDQSQVNGTDDVPLPPFNKYTIDAYANPNNLAMPAFYTAYEQADTGGPPLSSQAQHAATVAGRAALEVVQQPVQWSGGGIDYPSVTYFVPDGGHVLILNEVYSLGAQPSAVFTHMIGSLTIGK